MTRKRTDEQAARAWLAALEAMDLDGLERVLDVHVVEGRPQFGEQFSGRAAVLGMYRDLPSTPAVRWDRITGEGRHWTAQGVIHYGGDDGWDHVVAVVETQGGAVARSDVYFAPHLGTSPPYHRKWSVPAPVQPPHPPDR